jgi:hypothetical protein
MRNRDAALIQKQLWEEIKSNFGKRAKRVILYALKRIDLHPDQLVQPTKSTEELVEMLGLSTKDNRKQLLYSFFQHIAGVKNIRIGSGTSSYSTPPHKFEDKLRTYKETKARKHFQSYGLLLPTSGNSRWHFSFIDSSPTCLVPPQIYTTTKFGKFRHPRYPGRLLDSFHYVTLPTNWYSTIKECPAVGNKVLLCRYPTKYPNIWSVAWITKGRAVADVSTYYGLMKQIGTRYKFAQTFKELGVDE